MKVRALISFASTEVTLAPGQEAEISNEVAKDLIACGYVEVIEKKTTKTKVVKENESK